MCAYSTITPRKSNHQPGEPTRIGPVGRRARQRSYGIGPRAPPRSPGPKPVRGGGKRCPPARTTGVRFSHPVGRAKPPGPPGAEPDTAGAAVPHAKPPGAPEPAQSSTNPCVWCGRPSPGIAVQRGLAGVARVSGPCLACRGVPSSFTASGRLRRPLRRRLRPGCVSPPRRRQSMRAAFQPSPSLVVVNPGPCQRKPPAPVHRSYGEWVCMGWGHRVGYIARSGRPGLGSPPRTGGSGDRRPRASPGALLPGAGDAGRCLYPDEEAQVT